MSMIGSEPRGVLLHQDSPYMLFDLGRVEETWPLNTNSARAFVNARCRYRGAACRCDGDTGRLCRVCARIFPFCLNLGAADISKRLGGPRCGPSRTVTIGRRRSSSRAISTIGGHPSSSSIGKPSAPARQRLFRACGVFDQYQVHASLHHQMLVGLDLVVEKFIPRTGA